MNCSIIITYYPNIANLNKMVATLNNCDVFAIIVDNTDSEIGIILNENNKFVLIENKENLGIAKAQNIGLKYAFEKDFDNVIFFDQDSCFDELFINTMLTDFHKFDKSNTVLSPIAKDLVDGLEYSTIKFNDKKWENLYSLSSNEEFVNTNVVISSGMLTSLEVINKVGFMDEDFFIDNVDTEWCIRAIKYNIQTYTDKNCVLMHKIGDKRIVFFGKQLLSYSNKLRIYYRLRNTFLQYRKIEYKEFGLHTIIYTTIATCVVVILSDKKMLSLKYLVKGLIDGLLNRTGKIYN